MAGRSGAFLKDKTRLALVQELHFKGDLKDGDVSVELLQEAIRQPQKEVMANGGEEGTGGCLACGEDDDHANVLLCEACNDEYHTYCLDPPLRSVPIGDWFCPQCTIPAFEDDGLDNMVNALSPHFTSRFGEICWAQGGVGFGWWPAFVYDPRLTVGLARNLARKNLGKRHLVYFFECHDAPFAVLTNSKMEKWEDGLLQDYHLGKTAKASGKNRVGLFRQALQAATVELGKPIEMRMDWNHTDQPQSLPSPKISKVKRRSVAKLRKQRQRELMKKKRRKPSSKRGFQILPENAEESIRTPVRRNLTHAIEALAADSAEKEKASPANAIEPQEDRELCCAILKKSPLSDDPHHCLRIGFVKLSSPKTCTFYDVRKVIINDLVPDFLSSSVPWKFYVPSLGPVSSKQEAGLGPVFPFLRSTAAVSSIGDGSAAHPLNIVITEYRSPEGKRLTEG